MSAKCLHCELREELFPRVGSGELDPDRTIADLLLVVADLIACNVQPEIRAGWLEEMGGFVAGRVRREVTRRMRDEPAYRAAILDHWVNGGSA